MSTNAHVQKILEDLKTPKSNFLSLYQDYATEICDAPLLFHQFTCYGVIATALGNKVWFQFGDQRIFPNIWFILLAPSSHFHKSTALAIGHRLLNRVSEDFVYPTEFSPEELHSILQDQPTGTFIFYEFMSFTAYLERQYMVGAKSLLTELYDSPPPRKRKIRKESFVIRDPAISIGAGTTTEWFLEKVRERDLFAGFLPRFIFLPGLEKERNDSFPPPADIAKQNALVKQLHFISEISGAAHFTSDALKLHDQFYHQYIASIASHNSFLSAFHERLQMYRLKFGLILEAATNPETFAKNLTITSRSIRSANHLVSFLVSKLEQLVEEEFVFTKFEAGRKKILKLIQGAGRIGIARKDLLRKSHLSVRFLDDVLSELFQEEKIASKQVKVEGSHKPSRVYCYQEPQP